MISVNSQPASDVDSNTTDDNKLTNLTGNDDSWTDVNLNEDSSTTTANEDPRNIHNMAHSHPRGGKNFLSVFFSPQILGNNTTCFVCDFSFSEL